jgi:hypothetical protein
MLSPLFSVSSFVVEEYNSLPVSITYKFADTGAVKTNEIFPKSSMFPLTKTITFDNKVGDMELIIHYTKTDDILKGLPDQVARYIVKAGKQKDGHQKLSQYKHKFQFKVCNNIHQIPILESSELIEEWQEEVKIAIKKPVATTPAAETKPGETPAPAQPAATTEQDFETKLQRKTRTEQIGYDTQAHALPPTTRT